MSVWLAKFDGSAINETSDRVELASAVADVTAMTWLNQRGTWEIQLAESAWAAIVEVWPAQDEPPLVLIATADGKTMFSGPALTATMQRDSSKGQPTTTVTLSGVDEWFWLDSRICWPQPLDLPPWTTSAYDSLTGAASTVIATLIRTNVGDLARSERTVPGVEMAASAGLGESTTRTLRLQAVSAAVSTIANDANLVVQPARTGGVVKWSISEQRQNSAVRLDSSALGDATITLSTPSSTTPIAGGSGQGTNRLFAVDGTTVKGAARVETFVDVNNVASQPTLTATAQAARVAGAATTSCVGTVTAQALKRLKWRTAWEIGDWVTFAVGERRWPVQITGAFITQIPGVGLVASPHLGDAVNSALGDLWGDVTGLAARFDRQIS